LSECRQKAFLTEIYKYIGYKIRDETLSRKDGIKLFCVDCGEVVKQTKPSKTCPTCGGSTLVLCTSIKLNDKMCSDCPNKFKCYTNSYGVMDRLDVDYLKEILK